MTRWATMVLAALCAALASLAIAATPAFAYTPRTYESQISVGPGPPQQIAVDSENRIWASEPNGFGARLYELNALNERLPTQFDTGGPEGSIAIDQSDNDLYVPLYGEVVVYSAAGLELSEDSISREGHLAVAVDNSSGPTAGRLYISRRPVEGGAPLEIVELFNKSGKPINFPRFEEPSPPSYISASKLTGTPAGHFTSPNAVAVGPHGELYVADTHKVDEFESSGEFIREISGSEGPGSEFTPAAIAVDPTTADLVVTNGRTIEEFSPSGTYLGQIVGDGPSESTSFSGINGIAVNSAGFLYVATADTVIDIFSPTFILPKVTYPGISNASAISPGEAAATLNAEVDPDGGGEIKTCEFEYVDKAQYRPSAADPFEAGATAACEPAPPYSGFAPLRVSAEVSGLTPGAVYYYRVLVGNGNGTTEALPQTFDLQPPSLESISSSNLTESTADLSATINPQGGETTYRFEYGPTTNYGSSVPIPAGDIGSVAAPLTVGAHLTGLEKHVVYHFRLVAENPFGTTAGEDQTFNFFPPSCPNSHVRQQTGAEFLPDCRAYELVSPGDAGGTILLAEGPDSPLATDPSRFAFGGILGKIPDAGGDPADVHGDLYVATRTGSGWVTRYVGLPATQRLVSNGPPNEPTWIEESPSGVLGDLSMDRFMSWADDYGGSARAPRAGPGSYAPFLWDSLGSLVDRLPTNYAQIPCEDPVGTRQGTLCGGAGELVGAVKPSPDFSHYFFSSAAAIPFDPSQEPLHHAPGSAYDDNLETNTVSLISKLPDGDPIEEGGGEFIAFPGVSTDGSHVLMSTGYPANSDFTGGAYDSGQHVDAERHLFMRVGGGTGGLTYPIALGHAVHYVGMTAAGTEVFFTSNEKLTAEAEDTSTNLYMWSEAKARHEEQPLTLISKPNGDGGTGNPSCPPTTWTEECGAVAYLTGGPEVSVPYSILHRGPGGNGRSDNAIAAEDGDIYFYSPVQLDGDKGVLGQRNLYDYRGGQIQYVTTFNTGPECYNTVNCTLGPLVRIQVSPDDTHMAFLTASKITSYENAGYLEMYTYDPATGNIRCVSCIPGGAPPTSNVEASINGLFMTDDGRVFFSTADPLVPQDTDGIRDVYEYVEGRPQLISAGAGSKEVGVTVGATGLSTVGLIGVSANGSDAYFSTYDTLVAADHNGSALKFYDARINGGFAEPPVPAPCAAADECAGPGTSAPPAAQNSTGADLGSVGNLTPSAKSKHRHRKKTHRAKRHRHPTSRRHG